MFDTLAQAMRSTSPKATKKGANVAMASPVIAIEVALESKDAPTAFCSFGSSAVICLAHAVNAALAASTLVPGCNRPITCSFCPKKTGSSISAECMVRGIQNSIGTVSSPAKAGAATPTTSSGIPRM